MPNVVTEDLEFSPKETLNLIVNQRFCEEEVINLRDSSQEGICQMPGADKESAWIPYQKNL